MVRCLERLAFVKRYLTNMVEAKGGFKMVMSLHVASVTMLVYAIGTATRTPVGKGLMHRVVIFPCICQKCTHCIDDFMCEMKAADYDKKYEKKCCLWSVSVSIEGTRHSNLMDFMMICNRECKKREL